jgi:hypothetical protein
MLGPRYRSPYIAWSLNDRQVASEKAPDEHNDFQRFVQKF